MDVNLKETQLSMDVNMKETQLSVDVNLKETALYGCKHERNNPLAMDVILKETQHTILCMQFVLGMSPFFSLQFLRDYGPDVFK